jgi:hypothetical protein
VTLSIKVKRKSPDSSPFQRKIVCIGEGIVMSIESAHDPRSALVKTKYFSLHPKPLERWLWRQGLPQAAERVFWLHWEEGMRAGDWCSEIPIKRVARECCVDPSTVTRAYQVLKSLALISREDPGRDPNNPFAQATAITEVRLPRELVIELSATPNRPTKKPETPIEPAHTGIDAKSPSPTMVQYPETRPLRTMRKETQAMWSRASATERARFFNASKDRLTAFEFDENTKLTPEDRGQILGQLAQLAAAKPSPAICPSNTDPAKQQYAGPRRLSVLELARARKKVFDLVPAAGAQEVLRQVIWAAEEGALRRFTSTMALNIALKKIREGAWGKPNRMPPNWLPNNVKVHAQPEQCSAA